MTAPVRIQLSRRKGWRMPPNTVSVARPGPHGNPFRIGVSVCGGRGMDFACRMITTNADAVEAFGTMLEVPDRNYPSDDEIRRDLRGKNLACWCKLCAEHADGKPFGVQCDRCAPCHADPLGLCANIDQLGQAA